MTRQAIDGGGWFDTDSATKYDEDTYWDGHNHCSKATGSQWAHEALYLTRKGVYIINAWSAWQGTRETWTRVSVEQAAAWLTENGHEAPTPALEAAVAAAEV